LALTFTDFEMFVLALTFTDFEMFAMNKSNQSNLNSQTQQMYHVVSPNSTEKGTFDDFRSLKFIQPTE